MKFFISTVLLFSSFSVLAAGPVLDCLVTRMVDYTYFEESLSTNEYPDVEINAEKGVLEASFGMSPYSAADGDKVTMKLNAKQEIEVDVKTSHGDLIKLVVERRLSLARAVIKVKEDNRQLRTIAYGVCDKGIL